MRRGTTTVIIGILIISLLATTSTAFAEDPGRKLGRGVTNVITGWLEIFDKIGEQSAEHNFFVGITWGLIKGVGYAIARTAVGAYEIATFPLPLPSEYEPVMQPEFVFGEK